MSQRQRIIDAGKVLKSKCYILITDKEAVMAGEFRGFSGIMKIHALKAMVTQAEKVIKRLQDKEKPKKQSKSKEKASVRNTRGRKKNSPNK